MQLAISVVIPTRDRAEYLRVALESLGLQDFAGRYEVLVVDDASTDGTSLVVQRSGARYVRHKQPRGLNAARNTGIAATTAPLIAFLDDDVYAPPGWLSALVAGAGRHTDAQAFGGPISARFEGPTPRSCGRERPPITTLDLGEEDTEAGMVWGANFALRREAVEQIGPFDEAVSGHGDEEDWLLALRAGGGRIIYVASAGVYHRRAGADTRLLALARAAYRRGRAARATDQRRGTAPRVRSELRTVAGCAWHTVHYMCPQGVIMGAHSAGRVAVAIVRANDSSVT